VAEESWMILGHQSISRLLDLDLDRTRVGAGESPVAALVLAARIGLRPLPQNLEDRQLGCTQASNDSLTILITLRKSFINPCMSVLHWQPPRRMSLIVLLRFYSVSLYRAARRTPSYLRSWYPALLTW
jgi:hypothetical protein